MATDPIRATQSRIDVDAILANLSPVQRQGLLVRLLREDYRMQHGDRKLAHQQKKLMAVALRQRKMPWQAIADQLGLKAASSALRLVQAAFKEWGTADVEALRREALASYEDLYYSLRNKIQAGDAFAIGQARMIQDSINVLMGLNAPQAQEMRFPDGTPHSITVIDKLEFHLQPVPDQSNPWDDSAHLAQLEAGSDPPGDDKVSSNGGSDGHGQDVVRPDLGMGPNPGGPA